MTRQMGLIVDYFHRERYVNFAFKFKITKKNLPTFSRVTIFSLLVFEHQILF